MRSWAIRHIVFAMAFLALAAQALSPSLLRISQNGDAAGGYLICASPDKVMSEQSLQAAKELAKLLGKEAPQETSQTEHCSNCVISHFAILMPECQICGTRLYSRLAHTDIISILQRVQTARGPPLGGRAPPYLT